VIKESRLYARFVLDTPRRIMKKGYYAIHIYIKRKLHPLEVIDKME